MSSACKTAPSICSNTRSHPWSLVVALAAVLKLQLDCYLPEAQGACDKGKPQSHSVKPEPKCTSDGGQDWGAHDGVHCADS